MSHSFSRAARSALCFVPFELAFSMVPLITITSVNDALFVYLDWASWSPRSVTRADISSSGVTGLHLGNLYLRLKCTGFFHSVGSCCLRSVGSCVFCTVGSCCFDCFRTQFGSFFLMWCVGFIANQSSRLEPSEQGRMSTAT